MYLDILQFPPEIRELVYKYCSNTDLINIACCSKSLSDSVQYLLWDNIKLPWRRIVQKLEQPLETFRFTSSLTFDSPNIINIPDILNYSHTNYTPQWIHTAQNYEDILCHCDCNRLVKLYNKGVLTDEGMKLTVRLQPKLKELSLIETYQVSSMGFQCIATLSELKKLNMQSCALLDSDIEQISKLPKLRELYLDRCSSIRDNAVAHISNIVKLQQLQIANNSHILSKSFRNIAKLTNLTFLNLEDTTLHDNDLIYLCDHLKFLRRLKIGGCDNISDYGLSKVNAMSSLEELDIHMCKHITNNVFSLLQHVSSLRALSFSLSDGVTVDVFLPIGKILSLKEISIINPHRKFSTAEIESFCKKTGMKRKYPFRTWVFSFLTLVKTSRK